MKTKKIVDKTIDVASVSTKLVGGLAIGMVVADVAAACLPPAVSTPAKILKNVGVYGSAVGINYAFDEYVDNVSELLHSVVDTVHNEMQFRKIRDKVIVMNAGAANQSN